MLFAIDIGHNCPPDNGAVSGSHREDVLTKQVGNLVIKKLKKRGHQAVSVTPGRCYSVMDSLRRRARSANRLRADYFVSIHFNAFHSTRANGSEVFIYNYHSSARKMAEAVLEEIVDLGFRNRRVKTGNFAVLRYTNMPAILIECCFISSREDMERFDAEEMATAIVDGLVGPPPPPPPEEVGVLKVKMNTYLKPSTDQSNTINRQDLYTIEVGEYRGKFLADEEAHYTVELDEQIGDRDVHYIFSGHCEFIPDPE